MQQLEWRIETVRDVHIPILFEGNVKGQLKFIPDKKSEVETKVKGGKSCHKNR